MIRIESDKKSLQLWHIALYLHKHHRYTNENPTTTMEIGTMNGQMELLCELVVSYSHYKRQAPPPTLTLTTWIMHIPEGGEQGRGGGCSYIQREQYLRCNITTKTVAEPNRLI